MKNPIESIFEFNQKANLLNGYNDYLEDSMVIEECLEGYNLETLSSKLGVEKQTPREISRVIMDTALYDTPNPISDIDALDKACDKTILAIGSMAKLGLDSHKIAQALNIVMEANLAKLGMPKDEKGKLTKPKGFKGPEERLAKLLTE